MTEELMLTSNDAQNYVALVNAIYDVKTRHGNRSTNHSLKGPRKLSALLKQNFECFDCCIEFKAVNGRYSCATTEHVIPYRYGSSCNRHNTVLLCDKCNNKRNHPSTEVILKNIEDHFGPIDYTLIPDKPIPFLEIR